MKMNLNPIVDDFQEIPEYDKLVCEYMVLFHLVYINL